MIQSRSIGLIKIIEEYEKNHPDIFIVEYQKKNLYSQGIDTLALLYERAQGKYIAICEGDDYWTDEYKLKKQVEFLEKYDEYSACYHNVYVVDENNNLYPEKQYLHVLYDSHDVYFKDICQANYLCGQTATVVCRNFWKQLTREQKAIYSSIKSNGDVRLSSYLTNIGKVRYLKDIMACYRKAYSNDSYSATTISLNMSEFYMNSAIEIKKMLKEILQIDYQPNLSQYADFAFDYWIKNRSIENWKIFRMIITKHCNFLDLNHYILMRIKAKLFRNKRYHWKLLQESKE